MGPERLGIGPSGMLLHFGVFQILFYVVFITIFVLFFVFAINSILRWNKNNSCPCLTVF